jgi:hypothetical protein
MIEILERRSLRPSVDISILQRVRTIVVASYAQTHPSIVIEPSDSSTIRKSASISDDFPAPVLRGYGLVHMGDLIKLS